MWTEMGGKKVQGPSETHTCLWLGNVSRSKAVRDEARAVCTEARLWRTHEFGHGMNNRCIILVYSKWSYST